MIEAFDEESGELREDGDELALEPSKEEAEAPEDVPGVDEADLGEDGDEGVEVLREVGLDVVGAEGDEVAKEAVGGGDEGGVAVLQCGEEERLENLEEVVGVELVDVDDGGEEEETAGLEVGIAL